ncbi:MAG: hypothetical protein RL136_1000 [Planctomycetota bacterium]|jgi:flagellar motor component MotA
MFAKIATVIIVLGAMYGALLVNRQKRIDAAAQISRTHFRLQEADRERVALQVKVARATTATALKERFGAERLAEYRSVPFRFDPSRATEREMGDTLTVVEPAKQARSQELGG